jgi:hypothetical protein
MKLHWFSPLPPWRSGVAEMAAGVLPLLAKAVDLTVWSAQERLERLPIAVRSLRGGVDWRELSRADLCVFHLGNSAVHHRSIWEIDRLHAGLVVLHDATLQELALGVLGEDGRPDLWLAMNDRHHGRQARRLAEGVLTDPLRITELSDQFPLLAPALARALGVLVHTPLARDRVAELIDLPVSLTRLPWFEPRLPRTRPRTPPWRLVTFGHLGPNRGIAEILGALERRRELPLKLDIYGVLWDPRHVWDMIARQRLDDRVTLHDFVPEEQLARALADADLALNLRLPTVGEASLSQLRIFAHALPSVVVRSGWYASLPPDAVTFVRAEHASDDLAAVFDAFAAGPETFRRGGEEGRRFLERHHTPEQWVDALLDLADRARAFRPQRVAFDLAARLGHELAGGEPDSIAPPLAAACRRIDEVFNRHQE